MAEESDDKENKENSTEDTDSEGEEGEKKSSSNLLIIIIAVVVLLGGVAGFLFFTSMGKGLIGIETELTDEQKKEAEAAKKAEEVAAAAKDLAQIAFVEIPELVVNLRSNRRKAGFLKLSVKLEVKNKEEAKTVEHLNPRIVDQLQVYLRGIDISDLSGHAGAERLRKALVERINTITTPIKVTNVLFEEFLVQ